MYKREWEGANHRYFNVRQRERNSVKDPERERIREQGGEGLTKSSEEKGAGVPRRRKKEQTWGERRGDKERNSLEERDKREEQNILLTLGGEGGRGLVKILSLN